MWQPLLQTVILTKRPFTSGANYRKIWNREADESPLRTITREQAAAVAARLAARYGDRVVVDFAMRYGNPSTASVIERLQAQGCERILFFPLYPQYSATTTATANDAAFRALMALRWQPAFRTVPSYHDHPLYIEALAQSVEAAYAGLERRPDLLVTSYHGMPRALPARGRPLPLPLPQDHAAAARPAGLRRGRGRRHLPVAVRTRGVAEALHGRGGRPPGPGRQAAHRDHGAGLRRRLRRDAGGDPARRSATPSSPRAARSSATSPA